MKSEMLKMNLLEPKFINNRNSFKVIFYGEEAKSGQVGAESGQVIKYSVQVLEYCKESKSTKEIALHLGLSSRSYVRENILKPLIKMGKLKYTNPNKQASNQKYTTVDRK